MASVSSVLDRSQHYLRDRGLLSFCFAVLDVALPEPYGTRFRARRSVFSDVCSPRDSTLSLADQAKALRHGFTRELYHLYGLHSGEDAALYLDDVSRRHAKYTNERPELLDDKTKFHDYLRECGFAEFLPRVYGYVENGQFYSDSYPTLEAVFDDHDHVVIKRCTGAAGNNVFICTGDDIQPDAEEPPPWRETDRTPRVLQKYLVTEYCRQAEYVDRIYPDATNTIRVLTLRTDDGIYIPAAVHRIGSTSTGALDNFSQGGLSASIDLETGELSAAAEPSGQGPIWHERHPDTGEPIAGVTVPGWPEIRDQLREIARETTAFSHVGWDLVVTDAGEFTVIEGNSYPDPDLIQVHEPLLAQETVREFYERHGVL